MQSGFYTIASGIFVNQRNIDTIGNNLVNIQTPGYRGEGVVNSAFEQELMSRLDSAGNTVLGDGIGASVAVIDDSITMFNTGLLKSTDRSLDIAINGNGFFNVKGSDGTTYLTRDGSFDVDNEGYLVLPSVGRVMGTNGDIAVVSSDFSVMDDGTVKNAKGQDIGKILITNPEDSSTLERTENGLFTSQTQLPVSTNYQLLQNSLELSNVNMSTEMTNLVAAQRALQTCSSALKIIDSLDGKAASQIASV